eukprot:772658-Rhodomonas_salina.1
MSLEAISEGEGKGRRSVPVRARGRKAPDGARVLLLLLIVVVLTGELPVVLPTESALIIGDLSSSPGPVQRVGIPRLTALFACGLVPGTSKPGRGSSVYTDLTGILQSFSRGFTRTPHGLHRHAECIASPVLLFSNLYRPEQMQWWGRNTMGPDQLSPVAGEPGRQ